MVFGGIFLLHVSNGIYVNNNEIYTLNIELYISLKKLNAFTRHILIDTVDTEPLFC